jgi:cyclase
VLKKRIIFTLLYDSGYFMLSRNFRLQRVGNLDWLQRNYNFTQVAFFIDELIVLDVSRGLRDQESFRNTLKSLATGCFVPISAGGGVRSVEDAHQLLLSGADKIVVNSPLFDNPILVKKLAQEFGQQCVVGSVDMKRDSEMGYQIYTDSGSRLIPQAPEIALDWLEDQYVGELFLNSMDQDGTGQGYDVAMLDQLPLTCEIPVILAGGVGNGSHLIVGFEHPRVDAVATANLFNFVGDGLQRVREELVAQGKQLAVWPRIDELQIKPFIAEAIL